MKNKKRMEIKSHEEMLAVGGYAKLEEEMMSLGFTLSDKPGPMTLKKLHLEMMAPRTVEYLQKTATATNRTPAEIVDELVRRELAHVAS